MTTRQYSSRSQQSTLTAAITSGATSITVVSGTGILGGVTIPSGRTFTLVIDPDTALEEIVDATAVSTNTFTITRAIDGSSAQDHSAGAVVRHMAIGRDFRDANLHAEASAYYNDGSGTGHTMHGIGSGEGDVVGTAKSQTLTNKTLTSPTISNPTFTGTPSAEASIIFEGTTADAYETTLTVVDPTQDNTITLPNTTGTVVIVDATQTLTNKTLTSPTISGTPVITGLSSAGMISSSATPKDYVDSILGSATAAATSAASAATSAASAATSASSAATSASNALTSANSASTSATAAATSAASAATSATAAATSATSAAASATTASNSASAAATSATSAATSASSALTSANSASTSATSAANSATASATSASAAATSATSAAASATAAATSAASAATSATSAAASAASAAAVLAGAIQASIVDAKGDLIVGTANDAVSRFAAASTNGYVLSVNSATATGLEWIPNDVGDITGVTAGTGLTGGGTSGAVTVSLDLSSANVFTAGQTATGYTVTGSTVPTNGINLPAAGTLGLASNSAVRMQIDGNGAFGLGIAPASFIGFYFAKNITGATDSRGIQVSSAVQSDVTGSARIFFSAPSTQASVFNLGTLSHFQAAGATVGAGSTIGIQNGFLASAAIMAAGVTNAYAFRGLIASASGAWNVYMDGTAANYFAGQVSIGTTSLTMGSGSAATNLGIFTNSTTSVGLVVRGTTSQTANLQEWQTVAGSVIGYIAPNGQVAINTSSTTMGGGGVAQQFGVFSNAATTVGAVIRGAASQTAALQQWQNSSGTVLANIGSGGGLNIASSGTLINVASSIDESRIAWIRGASYSVRFGSETGIAANIDGVDTSTGTTSYQPLRVGGSTLALHTGGTTRLSIDASGNVGIGPIVAGTFNKGLSLNSEAGQYAGILLINNATGTTNADGSAFYISNSDLVINNREAATISIQNNGGERININSSGNVTINAVADATTTTAARGGGYMGIPQSTAATTGAYTIVAADAGEHIYSTATRTVTIPANSSVAFPVGTVLTFIAGSGATVTIAITTDTMYLAGPGTTGSRTLAAFGMATAVKITSTSWIISGNGLT